MKELVIKIIKKWFLKNPILFISIIVVVMGMGAIWWLISLVNIDNKINTVSFRTYRSEWVNGARKKYSMWVSMQLSTGRLPDPYAVRNISSADWLNIKMTDQNDDSLILTADKTTAQGAKLWNKVKSGNMISTKIEFFCESYNIEIVELSKIIQ